MLEFISRQSSFNLYNRNDYWISLFIIRGRSNDSLYRFDLPLTVDGKIAIIRDGIVNWDYFSRSRYGRGCTDPLTSSDIQYVTEIIQERSKC